MKVGALILLVAVANSVATPASSKAIVWGAVLGEVNSLKTAVVETGGEVVDLIAGTHAEVAASVEAVLRVALEEGRPILDEVVEKIEAQTWTIPEAEEQFGILAVILENARIRSLEEMEILHPVLIADVDNLFTGLKATAQAHKTNIIILLSE